MNDLAAPRPLPSTALTPGQRAAEQRLLAFLDDPAARAFVLQGYAGTGKTFLVGQLVRHLRAQNRRFALTAPTGRGARVLTQKAEAETSTLHRILYSYHDLEVLDDDAGSHRFRYRVRENNLPADAVVIVDEASVVSDVGSDQELMTFGSGRLLSDLVRFLTPHQKVVFVGDPAQLPPVGMASSPALDPAYLETAFGLLAPMYVLTDVVRQESASPVLAHATWLRDALNARAFYEHVLPEKPPALVHLAPEAFEDAFLAEPDDGRIVVAHSNKRSADYNRRVRARLFPGADRPEPGDRVLVVRNTYAHGRALFNGEFGHIEAAEPDVVRRRIPLEKEGDRRKEVTLVWRQVRLRFEGDEGAPFVFEGQLLENVLTSDERGATLDEQRALFADFRIRHPHPPHPHPKKDRQAFQDTLRRDPFFNALHAKYGYAVTCHKAQGGEWPVVFVDFALPNALCQDGFRWAYTALTRTSDRLFAINPPAFPLGKGAVVADPGTPDPPPEGNFLYALDAAVSEALAAHGVALDGEPERLQYRVRFPVRVGEARGWADVQYRTSGHVSRAEPLRFSDEAAAEVVRVALAPLVGRVLSGGNDSAAPAEPEPHDFPFPFLYELYTRLRETLGARSVIITAVEHLQYKERYALRRGAETARLDIGYNQKARFRFEPSARPGDAPALVREVAEILRSTFSA